MARFCAIVQKPCELLSFRYKKVVFRHKNRALQKSSHIQLYDVAPRERASKSTPRTVKCQVDLARRHGLAGTKRVQNGRHGVVLVDLDASKNAITRQLVGKSRRSFWSGCADACAISSRTVCTPAVSYGLRKSIFHVKKDTF